MDLVTPKDTTRSSRDTLIQKDTRTGAIQHDAAASACEASAANSKDGNGALPADGRKIFEELREDRRPPDSPSASEREREYLRRQRLRT
jgi:hypothetical protein